MSTDDPSKTDLDFNKYGTSGTRDKLIEKVKSQPDTRPLESVDQMEIADGTYETRRRGPAVPNFGPDSKGHKAKLAGQDWPSIGNTPKGGS
jgi:hypothetical protein